MRWFKSHDRQEVTPISEAFSQRDFSHSPELGQSLFWRGTHPSAPKGEYFFEIKSKFPKRCDDDTHLIRITLTLKGQEETRLLYEKSDNFETPGLEPNNVAISTTSKLLRFLLSLPDPKRVSGAFNLLYRGEEYKCPFELVYANYRRDLLVAQLKKLSISYDQFMEDRDSYNKMRGFPKT